jgi:hypothetical protein
MAMNAVKRWRWGHAAKRHVHTRLRERPRGRHTVMITLAVLIVAVAALRAALPSIVRWYANAKLSRLEGYRGRVEGVDIHLWRGAYTVRRFKLEKLRGDEPVPFFTCDEIDLSVEWPALLHGSIVGEIALRHPTFNLEPEAAETGTRKNIDKSGSGAVGALMPLKVNRLTVEDGEVWYRDRASSPPVDLRLSEVSGGAENLSTVRAKGKELPASVYARATVFETGNLALAMNLDPLASAPTFLLRSSLRGVKLVALNELLDAYAKFRAKQGDFELFTEIAAKDGAFKGYVKPIIRDLKIEKKGARTVLRKLWAHVVSAAGALLANPKEKQVATRIPFEGKFGDADTDLWAAVGGLLKNAFIKALTPSLDHSVRMGDVKKRR